MHAVGWTGLIYAMAIIACLEKTQHFTVAESISKFDHATMIIACLNRLQKQMEFLKID